MMAWMLLALAARQEFRTRPTMVGERNSVAWDALSSARLNRAEDYEKPGSNKKISPRNRK